MGFSPFSTVSVLSWATGIVDCSATSALTALTTSGVDPVAGVAGTEAMGQPQVGRKVWQQMQGERW